MGGELAVELPEKRNAIRKAKLGAGGGERGIRRRRGAVDDEARAGKRLKHRREGRIAESCAQARRARSASNVVELSAPSSARPGRHGRTANPGPFEGVRTDSNLVTDSHLTSPKAPAARSAFNVSSARATTSNSRPLTR